jgi:potassium large conductance calcium-activated channel subfamily M alpha protein 1
MLFAMANIGCPQGILPSDVPTLSPEDQKCLEDRKWWAFLLSSIFTLLAGIFIVLIYRLIEFLCAGASSHSQQSNAPNSKANKAAMPSLQLKDIKANIPQELAPTKDLGWMTEAKDWAGELISGQSTTGRILVSLLYFDLFSSKFTTAFKQ